MPGAHILVAITTTAAWEVPFRFQSTCPRDAHGASLKVRVPWILLSQRVQGNSEVEWLARRHTAAWVK